MHKICLVGPSEAVKKVWVKLTPSPMLRREKRPPCGIGLNFNSIEKLHLELLLHLKFMRKFSIGSSGGVAVGAHLHS